MLSQIKKGRCLGLDDTQVKLIMPKDLPDKAEGIEDPQIKRLIEKMIEAKKEKKDSLDAKTPILNRRRYRQLYRWIFKPF